VADPQEIVMEVLAQLPLPGNSDAELTLCDAKAIFFTVVQRPLVEGMFLPSVDGSSKHRHRS
jgi:hypothetical protein